MNHIYRVIFNRQTGTFQAVSEIAKSTQKTSKGKFAKAFKAFLTPISLAISLFFGLNAHAAPTGGQVVAGQAIINQADLSTNINQTSQNAVINWQSFNVANNETVNFNQPNAQATTLNRVIGNERSVIDGALNASGKVFISNPNGMLIGKNAQINVGALVATTAKIKDQDFMNGLFKFDEATGTITQLGDIKVPKGGVVALIAPIVENKGKITAPQGKVLLASAEKFSITLPDNANFKYTLDQGTLQGLVDNGGAILADGGHIVLTARGTDAVKKSLIKHTGVAQANTVQNNKGVIELLGDLDNSKLEVVGSLKAEAKESGDGGFIETSASKVDIDKQAIISTNAENGKTGTWVLDPNDFVVAKTGGDLTGEEVAKRLKNTNIQLHTINSNDGKTTKGNGDIIINDEISWDKNTLTLKAHHDIHINANLNGSGTARLALEYGQGSSDGRYKAMVDGKETTLDNDYYLDQKTPVKDRTVKINLPEGKTFSTKKGSDGDTIVFDVIHKMPEIVKNNLGEWESKFTTDKIAFGKDIDVSHTKNYEGFAGWIIPSFTNVVGLGHKVDNLVLYTGNSARRKPTGLFQNGYSFRDIGVTNIDLRLEGDHNSGGGLVGSGANIYNSYVTGNILTTGDYLRIGGLAGRGSDIFNSYASVDISTTGRNTRVGGLIGSGLNISNSYALGNVVTTGDNTMAGGLLGNGDNISNSYATGNVSTTGNQIGNPLEEGNSVDAGGLVGRGENISNSYATGNVSSSGINVKVGGLVGRGENISNSYATGNVLATGVDSVVGGLAGYGYYISNSYTTGDILTTGNNSDVGGLTGYGNYISNSYVDNRMQVSGESVKKGGITGNALFRFNLSNTFFNQDKNPSMHIVGDEALVSNNLAKITNVTGKSETELKTKSTFEGWDFDNIWYMNEGGMPKLRAFAQTLTVNPTPTPPTAQTTAGVKAPDLSKTYDGKTITSVDDLKKLDGWKDNFDADGLTTGDSVESIFKAGTLTIDETKGDWKGAKDVKEGGYELYPTGTLKDEYQQKYIIEWNKGVLTINKKPISIIGNKTYDGTNYAIAKDFVKNANEKNKVSLLGAYNQDDVSVHISNTIVQNTGYLSGKDVGTHNLTNLGTLKLDGKDAKNYELSLTGSYWTINKAPLKIKALNNFVDVNESGVSLLDNNLRDNIGIVSNGLIGDEKIDVSKLKIKIEKDGDSDKNRLGHTYNSSPIMESIDLVSGKISNYDITIENGKIYTLPERKNSFYDFPNGDDDTKQVEKLISYANDLNSVKDEFLAAQVVYNEDFGKNELQELNKLGVTDLIHLDNANGVDDLQMALYRKANSNSYIISYRGSETKWDDWVKTNAVTVFEEPESYRDSVRITSDWISKIQKDNPNAEIIFTGHSLGGSLAQYNSAIDGKNRRVIAFNSAPLRSTLIDEIESKANCKNIQDCSSNAKNFKFDNDILRNIESPLVRKNKQLLGEIKDFRLFTTGPLSDHLNEHMNDVYKVSTAIKENSDYLNNAMYQPAKISKFSHLDLSAVIPVGRLESVGATAFNYIFILPPEAGATIVGAENQEKIRDLGGNVHEVLHTTGGNVREVLHTTGGNVREALHTVGGNVREVLHTTGGNVHEVLHTTSNDLRELMGKYYKDMPNNDNSLKEYLHWRIINDKYDYEFQGHTLTASKRATDQMRMVYIMYQLGIINDGDAQSLFYLIKDNYKQALSRKYNNTKDRYAKQGIQKTIKSWELLTFEIWKNRAGNFVGNDITGDWK